MQFFATTAKAMEPLLAEELRAFGALKIEQARAGVSFEGSLETAYRACLWSRIANRILLPILTFSAPDERKLYAGVKSIRWSDHVDPSGTLAVEFNSSSSRITHTHFGALKVKDAVVDQLRSIHGVRPSVDPARPDLRINVYLMKDEASVAIDLSGESLHKRGYREEGAGAPVKENLAAALLLSSEWPKIASEGGAFLDLMCGSGTLALEAALIAADIAPGLGREYFGFLGWKKHDRKLWDKLKAEALQRKASGLARKHPKILGFDSDARAIRVALANLERSGLKGLVHFEKRDLAAAEAPAEKGLVLVNPPYGERLGEVEELKPLYKLLGDTFKKKFQGWQAGIFTGSPELAKVIGLRASRRVVLFNGPIECRLLKYELYSGSAAPTSA